MMHDKLEKFKDIPDEYLPSSVITLRQLLYRLSDTSEGTKNSIKANPFAGS
jgi:hypothetical protein